MEIQNNNKANFYRELVEEILLRLPVKPLIQFKCVSKSWQSMISDPKFAKSHFDRTNTPSPSPNNIINNNKLLYVDKLSPTGVLIDVETSILSNCAEAIQLPIRTPTVDFLIQGSCRGFMLLVDYPHLILWNPTTGSHKRLHYSHATSKALSSESYKNNSIYVWGGLGYDASNDDYIIVIGRDQIYEEMRPRMTLDSHAEVYSVRTNSWKKIGRIDRPYMMSYLGSKGRGGIFANGAIHWLALNRGYGSQLALHAIFAFDLVEKRFKQIPLPNKTEGYYHDFTLLGGCIGVCYTEHSVIGLWVVKEYGVQSSWTRVMSASVNPVCFTRDEKLIARDFCGRLVKYDEEGRVEEIRGGFNVYGRDMTVPFTETLLSLP